MTYANIAAITQSVSLMNRITAAAAEEEKPIPYDAWVRERMWQFAASPGWAAAWGSALASGIVDPGASETVITDGMILAEVQPMP
jgi:hypothetical protein